MHEVTEVTYQPVLGKDLRERYKVCVSIAGLLDHKALRKMKAHLWDKKLLDPTVWGASLDKENNQTRLDLMILPQNKVWVKCVDTGIPPYSKGRVLKLAAFPEDFWTVGVWQGLLENG